ncbi:MAG TPA: DinB family protein, partial [Longimicrobiaceae bacterium]|nr:DinB family protein [Longimicrobiaceae bacterium]
HWRQWFAAAPAEVLSLPLGPGSDEVLRDLVKHVFAVELRYAQRLVGQPETDYADLADADVAALWQIHARAVALRDGWLAAAGTEELDRMLTFQTRRAGTLQARAHAVVVHTYVHSIRHWAQIATLLRQHGHGGLWQHDWLLNPAVR